jgi:hypothetical protein
VNAATRYLIAFSAVVAAAAVAACADFSSPEDPTGGLPDVLIAHPSLNTDIQPIFTKRCAIGGCHTPASARAGLVLAQGIAYDSLVNKVSKYGNPMVRVKPGDHVNSWLWHALQSDASIRNGLPQMPLASTPLTANQLQNIINWIDDGAPNN